MPPDLLLVLNAGSSSVKIGVYEDTPALRPLVKDRIDVDRRESADGGAVVNRVLGALDRSLVARLNAVGHRIVHGGQTFTSPVLLDARTLARLEALVALAPLHQPVNLAIVADRKSVV